MNFSWLPWNRNKIDTLDVELALSRVYGEDLTNLMKNAAELSAQDVEDLQRVIDTSHRNIDEANRILQAIIDRHTAVRDRRVNEDLAKLSIARIQQEIARHTLEGAKKYLGLK